MKKSALSKKQEEIAYEPVNTKMLLIAGPGTGKTHTLMYRLKNLVVSQGLKPYNEILFLSFTRSAVNEIRSRVSEIVDENYKYEFEKLNIYTFDSFASRLLLAANPEDDLSYLDYDQRILLAINKLEDTDSQASNLISGVRHILVDEIQDLTGVRAMLVETILSNVSCGFTLAGDPAQGIYDFQIQDSEIKITSVEFLEWIRAYYKKELKENELIENFRSQNELLQFTNSIRPYALPDIPNGMEKYRRICQKIRDNFSESMSIKDLKPDQTTDQRISILCRLNAEVMAVNNKLRETGFASIIPPSAEEKGLPAWVARILSSCNKSYLRNDEFTRNWKQSFPENYFISSEESWKILKNAEGKQHEHLDINALRRNLRMGTHWVHESEAQNTEGKILVTTIHQSKGREYDHVICLPPVITGKPNNQTFDEETRVLYVAMTRAKKKIDLLKRAGIHALKKIRSHSGNIRYITTNRKGEKFIEAGIQGDIEEDSFVANSLFRNTKNINASQNLIWHYIKPGTEILIKLEPKRNKFILGIENPRTKNMIPLAYMSNQFYEDLFVFMTELSNKPENELSKTFRGLNVIERKTIILPPFSEDIPEPYADSGFCLGVTCGGMIKIQ